MNKIKGLRNLNIRNFGIYITITILLIFMISIAVALISNQKINSGAAEVTSDQQLICYWTLGTTTNANITWYRNDVANLTQNDIACTSGVQCSTSGGGNVPSSSTFRDDVWICQVTHYNGTSSESQNISVNIINTPPTYPKVYWQNGTETTNSTASISEGNNTQFNVTSTDADTDSITYTLNDTTFCSINSGTGVLACNPTLKTHVGIRVLKLGAQDSSTAKFTEFTINVTPINNAPFFNPLLTNQTIYEGQSFNYTITGMDLDDDYPYNFSISSDFTNNSTLILIITSNTTAVIQLNNSGQNNATWANRGNHTVNVTITDQGVFNFSPRNFTASFNLEIIPVNHRPNISYSINTTYPIQEGQLVVYFNATDIDSDNLTFYTNNSDYTIITNVTNHINGTAYVNATINITQLNNSHVVNRYVDIIVDDTKENTTITLFFNITNTNDAPIINVLSYNTDNTLNNTNITDLIAYTSALLRYHVNGTDPDQLTYAGDNLTYSSNDSNYPVNGTTGLTTFMPLVPGNYTFKVTVTDAAGLNYNITARVQVLPNTNPIFTQQPIIISCNEYDILNNPVYCYYNVSTNVTDNDSGDYVARFDLQSTFFTINLTSGIVNFTANQSMIGNYSLQLNISDTRGASNTTQLQVFINNTNNAPNITNLTLPAHKVVIGYNDSILINVTDNDLTLNNTYENLTFNVTINGPNSSIFTFNKTSSNIGIIYIVPLSNSDAGNYSINITITDYYNNISNRNTTIFVYNRTSPPNITQIYTYGSPLNNVSVTTSWVNTTFFNSSSTSLITYENVTHIFNHVTSADNSSYTNSVNYSWYLDGVFNVSTSSMTKYFDFFSSGTHNITLVIEDEYYSTNRFTWLLNVNNLNRPPILVTSLFNISINGTTTFSNYLSYYNAQIKFYDPDDDPNSVGYVNGGSSTITYSVTDCSVATLEFVGTDLKVAGGTLGSCNVTFTAHDNLNYSSTAVSNNVIITILQTSSNESQQQTPTQTITTGGASTTRTVNVPVTKEVEKPKPLELITPKLVTVYKNSTIKVPIVLNNTWIADLEGITLYAKVNVSDVKVYLDRAYYAKLSRGQSVETTLTIFNYKSEGHYEIQVIANVTNPIYRDTATIFVNAADLRGEGEEIEQKIGFARDLLSSNPECQELTELLTQAKKELSRNNFLGAGKMVDNVISGCKYLVNNAKDNKEQPNKGLIDSFEWKNTYNQYIIFGGFELLMIIALYYVFKKDNTEDI
jgi:hypothetical protein